MQYVKGETLAARIQRKPMDLQEPLDVAAQVADALAEAHSHGIIHRDIKRFAYSRDGKQLALARGNLSRDTVMISESK